MDKFGIDAAFCGENCSCPWCIPPLPFGWHLGSITCIATASAWLHQPGCISLAKRKLYRQISSGTQVPLFLHDKRSPETPFDACLCPGTVKVATCQKSKYYFNTTMTLLKELCWDAGRSRWVLHGVNFTPWSIKNLSQAGGAGIHGCFEMGCSVVAHWRVPVLNAANS